MAGGFVVDDVVGGLESTPTGTPLERASFRIVSLQAEIGGFAQRINAVCDALEGEGVNSVAAVDSERVEGWLHELEVNLGELDTSVNVRLFEAVCRLERVLMESEGK